MRGNEAHLINAIAVDLKVSIPRHHGVLSTHTYQNKFGASLS